METESERRIAQQEAINGELKQLIDRQRKISYREEYQAKTTDADALGVMVANYLKWDSRVINCCLYAYCFADELSRYEVLKWKPYFNETAKMGKKHLTIYGKVLGVREYTDNETIEEKIDGEEFKAFKTAFWKVAKEQAGLLADKLDKMKKECDTDEW